MQHMGRRLFLLVVLLNLVSYFVLMAFGFLNFPAASLMEVYLWPWTLNHALVGMVDAFIPVTITAILLGFSLFYPRSMGKLPLNFSRIASSSVPLFLLLVALFTILEEGLAPGVERRLAEMEGNSSFALGSLDEARRLSRLKQNREALLYFDYYLSVNPENDEVQAERDNASAALDLDEDTDRMMEGASPLGDGRFLNMSAADLSAEAERFLARRDYYSAHYYATLARELNPQREDARRIAAEAWNRINSSEFSREAEEAGDLFRRKREAYGELDRGNVIEAYYRFQELSREYPLDADARRFSEETKRRLAEEAFFIDELEHARTIPGRHRIFFINRIARDVRELIYFERFIPLGNLGYAYGVEIIAMTPAGETLYHLRAPYGKVLENDRVEEDSGEIHLLLRAVEQEGRGRRYEPEVLSDSQSVATPAVHGLEIDAARIAGFSLADATLQQERIHELLRLRPEYEGRGYNAAAIEIELIMRLMRPFGLLIFCYLAIALGWMLRIQGRRKLLHFLLLPVIPLVLFIIADLYLYSSRLIYLYFILQTGFTITLVTMLMIQALLLTGSLILIAVQSNHEPA